MEETNKKSIYDVLLLTLCISALSFVVLYIYMKKAVSPSKKNFGKVVGKSPKKRSKRNADVMSSNNSSVSIEVSTAEMD
ncbi:uncharacterized protein NEMAJ01_0013 [Nematocida major]|uniref:uncharacterized protein n=1 Tax=Nematocida major TaxID=1912982 RepID=UPI0020079A4F|nr:uncharacterized protein NEMAJ01_0013 [Nematocida major]KAH9385117.1 hypothetical protein NEMAJ01_0013 [Nematocida major]